MASFSIFGSSRESFSIFFCQKRTFRSDFVKLRSKNTLFIFGREMVVCFVFCVAILRPILAYFFINCTCSSRRAEKDAVMYLNSTMDF